MEKTAQELFDEVAMSPTALIDQMMRQDPATHSREDRLRFVEAQRRERAAWLERKAQKKDEADD